MLSLLGPAPGWRAGDASNALPNTLPGWTIALLALHGDWIARDRLLALLWPDAAPAEAQHNLRVDLHRVRQLLDAWGQGAALEAERRRVRLLLPTDAALLRRAAEGQAGPMHYPGPLLASMGFEGFPALHEWVEIERAALARLWHRTLVGRIERAGTAQPDRLALAQTLLDADPLDEAALIHLLRALRELGRGAEADRRFEAYRDRLARELGSEPSAAVRALARPAERADADDAEAGDRRAFIGRRLELAELERRLAEPGGACLHTIVGPGGAGKSSLARQALARAGVPGTWVDLQDLADVDAVAARIAQRLGTELRDGADAAQQLVRTLGAVPRLLVLDNAEHVAGLEGFVARLLDAPALAVLLTSRRPLAAPGERLLPLEGLARPDEQSRDAEAAAAFDAVRLFVARARAADAGFTLAPHLDAVLDIVDAVGGLPLAIELAAGWLRLLSPQAIARELRQSLAVLQRDPDAPGLPGRAEHASMRAVLDGSWALLALPEREALEALAVFEGGFAPAAALAVAGVALPLLSSLADQGLLAVDEAGRFAMHPLVAADAAQRLAAHEARRTALRDQHAGWWAATLEAVLAQSATDPRAIVAAVNADIANTRAAWLHAVAARRHDDVRRLVPVWRAFFDTTGRYGEGARLLAAALDLPPDTAAAERAAAAVRGALSMLLFRRQNLEQALAVAEAGIALAERCGERRSLVSCLLNAGSVHSIQGRWPRARPLYERALAIAGEDHERAETAVAQMNLGICAKKDGLPEEALAWYHRALALERELGRHLPAVRCLNNIGVIHMERSEWDRTREYMAEGLRLCRQYDIAALAPYLETGLGQALYELGQFEDAERHLAHVQATVPAEELPVVHMNVTINLGRVGLRRGRLAEARRHFFAAARLALASETDADALDFAMYWAEWLRDSGRREDAARTWLAVIAHPRTEAGVRQGCEDGLATLALAEAERAAALARLPTLETMKAEWAALPSP